MYRDYCEPVIQPEWAAYHRRRSINLLNEPEILTSNWLRILSVPDQINYVVPTRTINRTALKASADTFDHPVVPHSKGFITFAPPTDFDAHFLGVGGFQSAGHVDFDVFCEEGWEAHEIEPREARSMVVNLLRQAESTAKNLLQVIETKKTELLFVALFLRLLKPGGRAAVIVPDGVLFGSTRAHKELRRILVEDQKLEAVVSMPAGVFRPYSGVSTGILLFTKTNSGGTDHVWFYDLRADGYSLDDKRTPLLDADLLDAATEPLSEEEHTQNNLPDVLARWRERNSTERECPRTEQSFCVPTAEIAANGYDLSINRYKEAVYEEIEYPLPYEILDELSVLEEEIQTGIEDLKSMLR